MTNYQNWRIYTDGFVSPDSYIDWGFYYLIAASLQRRVWLTDHSPIYPNMYVLLVGDPSVGKGLVVKQVASILRHHKLPDPTSNRQVQSLQGTDKTTMETIASEDYKTAQEREGTYNAGKEPYKKNFDRPLLIPVAADASTYEALVRALAKSLRHINYKKFDAKLNKEVLGIYAHSSICFCLEEISSLFRKRTEDLVHFLLETYDCGDYEYDAKTPGLSDRVKKCCLNFFGGTTPAFMQECFEDALLTEGFSSRTFFIFAANNRKTAFFVPDLTPEQISARESIIAHVEKLSKLYGPVHIDPEDKDWLELWWKKAQIQRPNISPKLNPYYGRKNMHVAKLGMALHFAESTEMHIPRSCFERAIEILAEEERSMHFALGLEKKNPLATPATKVLKYIEQCGKKTFKELLAEFWEILPNRKSDLEEIIDHLQGMGKLKKETEKLGEITQNYYYVITAEKNGGNIKHD